MVRREQMMLSSACAFGGPMTPNARQTALSARSTIGDTGASIEIEPHADGAVIVRVTYPDDRRRNGAKGLVIACSCLCLVPVIAAWLFRGSKLEEFWIVGSAILAICSMVNLVRQFIAVTRSFVFRADQDGLMVETWNGLRRRTRQFTCDQIKDIVLGFSYHKGPYSLFSCWMTIVTGRFSEIRCLHRLGGNHLGPIADALRAGLGLPKRSWP